MIEFATHLIIQFIENTGYLGIFILMTLESALVPIPSEITMPFAGFLVQRGELNLAGVILTGAFANVFGSLIAYGLGYYLEEHIILKHLNKYGKYFLLNMKDYERSLNWLKKHGDAVAFFSRVLPAVRTFISLPAGLSEMNVFKFAIYTFLGSLIWSTFLTYIGVYFGENWHVLEPYFRQFQILIGAVFVIAVLVYLNHKLEVVHLPFNKDKKTNKS